MQLASSDRRRSRRYAPTVDDGLGNLWTKFRDKVIKPVGRVVAAYYTGGASELAFQSYDKAQGAKKQAQAEQAYLKSVGTGPGAVPSAYPPGQYPPGYTPPRQPMPQWVIPAAAGVGALLILKSVGGKSRRR
jgi:hypothetical protein